MRVGRHHINPIDAILAVLLPVTLVGLYVELYDKIVPEEIFHAAFAGDRAKILERVNKDFDFLAYDDRGRTLLHIAAELGDAKLVEYVLQNGGAVSLGAFDDYGYTPMHLSLGIPTPIDRKTTRPAVQTMNGGELAPAFRSFLDFGCNPNAKTRGGLSLLAFAIKSRREDVALLLVEAGADTNLGTVGGRPLLTTVIANGMTDLLSALLERGVPADPGPPDRSPLAYAISCGDADSVRLLLDHGASPNKRLETGWRSFESSRIRADEGGTYINWHQADGTVLWGPVFGSRFVRPMRFTPLDYALMRNRACAPALIEHGARSELIPMLVTLAFRI